MQGYSGRWCLPFCLAERCACSRRPTASASLRLPGAAEAQRSATSKAVSWSKDRSHFSTFNGSLVGGGVHAYHHHYVVQ